MNSGFERLKDHIYNYSDIVITLIIIIAAALLITWRTGIVLSYGQGDDSASATAVTEESGTSGSISGTSGAADLSAEAETADGTEMAAGGVQMSEDGTLFTVTIPDGATTQDIADILYNGGLTADTQTFLDSVAAGGLEGNLRAGTFEVPAGSTMDELVTILTTQG